MIKVHLAIVVSEFNHEITDVMLEEARVHASKLNSNVSHICYVPGTFDMPLMISHLLQNNIIENDCINRKRQYLSTDEVYLISDKFADQIFNILLSAADLFWLTRFACECR